MKSFKRASSWDLLKTEVTNKNELNGKDEFITIKFPASKFLIFQSTIVASVLLESN